MRLWEFNEGEIACGTHEDDQKRWARYIDLLSSE